ncbi:MAG: clan AA aspartic protease [Cyanobacteria bacterium P01_F01_bin.150]
MMQGFANQSHEAIIPAIVGHNKTRQQMLQAVIDTGFTGFLSLPLSTIESLELPWIFRDAATLGDGSEVLFAMYRATVIWHGKYQVVDVAASEAEPLVGMSLLHGSKLQIEAVEGGIVTIETMT